MYYFEGNNTVWRLSAADMYRNRVPLDLSRGGGEEEEGGWRTWVPAHLTVS